MKLFSKMDQIHTSEKWIKDTLDLCNKETENINMPPIKEKKRNLSIKKFYPILVAAVALAIIIPISVVAANHMRNMSVLQNGKDVEVIVNRETIAVEDIVSMKINVAYIPDGMIKYSRGPKYYNAKTPNQGGFSLLFWRLDSETSNFQFPVETAVSSQEININGYEAVLVQKEKSENVGISFDRQMFIYYSDKGYVIQIYIGEDMSLDQIKSFASGLTLEQSSEDDANGTWASYLKNNPNETKVIQVPNNTNQVQVGSIIGNASFSDIYSIHEPFLRKNVYNIPAQIEEYNSLQISVENVTVQKNFDGITTDTIGRPADYSSYLNTNGTPIEDGYSIVIIDIKYKNISDKDLKNEYCICPILEALSQENDHYVVSATRTGADMKSVLHPLCYDGGFFSFYTDLKGSHNEIAALSAGLEANVRLAFLVRNEYLQNMFLVQKSPSGWDIVSQNQYVDIRQK